MKEGSCWAEIQQFSGRYYYESQNKKIFIYGDKKKKKITFTKAWAGECS